VDRDPEKGLRRKPFALGVGILFFLGFLAFWGIGRQETSVPAGAAIESRILEERAIPQPPDSVAETSEPLTSDAEAEQP